MWHVFVCVVFSLARFDLLVLLKYVVPWCILKLMVPSCPVHSHIKTPCGVMQNQLALSLFRGVEQSMHICRVLVLRWPRFCRQTVHNVDDLDHCCKSCVTMANFESLVKSAGRIALLDDSLLLLELMMVGTDATQHRKDMSHRDYNRCPKFRNA